MGRKEPAHLAVLKTAHRHSALHSDQTVGSSFQNPCDKELKKQRAERSQAVRECPQHVNNSRKRVCCTCELRCSIKRLSQACLMICTLHGCSDALRAQEARNMRGKPHDKLSLSLLSRRLAHTHTVTYTQRYDDYDASPTLIEP